MLKGEKDKFRKSVQKNVIFYNKGIILWEKVAKP